MGPQRVQAIHLAGSQGTVGLQSAHADRRRNIQSAVISPAMWSPLRCSAPSPADTFFQENWLFLSNQIYFNLNKFCFHFAGSLTFLWSNIETNWGVVWKERHFMPISFQFEETPPLICVWHTHLQKDHFNTPQKGGAKQESHRWISEGWWQTGEWQIKRHLKKHRVYVPTGVCCYTHTRLHVPLWEYRQIALRPTMWSGGVWMKEPFCGLFGNGRST